jgi:hypothetical protein
MKDTKLTPNECDVSINIIYAVLINGNLCIRYRIRMRTGRYLIIIIIIIIISTFSFVFHFNIITVWGARWRSG